MRPQRLCALRSRLCLQQAHESEAHRLLQLYRGEIVLKDVYFNPHALHSDVVIAEIPRNVSGTFWTTLVYQYDDHHLEQVKSLQLMIDHSQYRDHIHTISVRYQYLSPLISAYSVTRRSPSNPPHFTHRRRSSRRLKQRYHRRYYLRLKVCVPSKLRFYYVHIFVCTWFQKFKSREFQNQCYFIGSRIWSNLRHSRMQKKRSHSINLTNRLFQSIGRKVLFRISRRLVVKRNTYTFSAILAKRFYKLFGSVYCQKEHENVGYFYIAPTTITYNSTSCRLCINYIVRYKNVNGHRFSWHLSQ